MNIHFTVRLLIIFSVHHTILPLEAITVDCQLSDHVSFSIDVDIPSTFEHRQSQVTQFVSNAREVINSLPSVCVEEGHDEFDCWVDEVRWLVETELVRLELDSMLTGKYWDIKGFFMGKNFGNEANRLILKQVLKSTPLVQEIFVEVMMEVIEKNRKNRRPFAAASHTMAQVLYEMGRFQDAFDSIKSSVLENVKLVDSTSDTVRHGLMRIPNDATWKDTVLNAKLNIIVVATSITPSLLNLQKSASVFDDIRIILLGHGEVWEGFGKKITWLSLFIDQIEDENELILFVDGYDVLFLEPLQQIKKRFLKQRKAILFSGESNCAPDSVTSLIYQEVTCSSPDDSSPDSCRSKFDDKANGVIVYPYLNSGSIMGLAKHFKYMLQDIRLDLLLSHAKPFEHFHILYNDNGGDVDDDDDDTGILNEEKTNRETANDSNGVGFIDNNYKLFEYENIDLYEKSRLSPFNFEHCIQDIEDQRWFTRFYLRFAIYEEHIHNKCQGSHAQQHRQHQQQQQQENKEEEKDVVDNNEETTRGSFEKFIGLDEFGDIFQTLYDTSPAQFIVGPVSSFDKTMSDDYSKIPLGNYGGAGMIYNKFTGKTPCLIHGNDYLQSTYTNLVHRLKLNGWPPEPLQISTSMQVLKSSSSSGDNSSGDSSGEDVSYLDVRWTDNLYDKLYQFQAQNSAWFRDEECTAIDFDCMTSNLQILVEQRLMKRELSEMHGNSFPLLNLFRGDPSIYSNFMADMFLRGCVLQDLSLVKNATLLLRHALTIQPKFAPTAHMLAEILFRFGSGKFIIESQNSSDSSRSSRSERSDGNGDNGDNRGGDSDLGGIPTVKKYLVTNRDKNEARNVLLRSIMSFDFLKESEIGVESEQAMQCQSIFESYDDQPVAQTTASSSTSSSSTSLEVITVSSEIRPALHKLELACNRLGFGFTVLGLDEEWGGLGTKIALFRKFLSFKLNVPSFIPAHQTSFTFIRRGKKNSSDGDDGSGDSDRNDGDGDSSHPGPTEEAFSFYSNSHQGGQEWDPKRIILFVDAYDVMLLPSSIHLIAKFKQFNSPIVFGAESASSPDQSAVLVYPSYTFTLSPTFPPRRRVNNPSSFSSEPRTTSSSFGSTGHDYGIHFEKEIYSDKNETNDDDIHFYLNSGTIMGYSDAILCMLLEIEKELHVLHELKGDGPTSRRDVNDQRWFTRYYLRHPFSIQLDHFSILFQTLHNMNIDRFHVEHGNMFLIHKKQENQSKNSKRHGNVVEREEGEGEDIDEQDDALSSIMVLHGNGQDYLFEKLCSEIEMVLGWPYPINTSVFRDEVSIPSSSSSSSLLRSDHSDRPNVRSNENRKSEVSDGGISVDSSDDIGDSRTQFNLTSTPVLDVLSRMKFDPEFNSNDFDCEALFNQDQDHQEYVSLDIMIDNVNQSLRVFKDDDSLAIAIQFAHRYHLISGAGCHHPSTVVTIKTEIAKANDDDIDILNSNNDDDDQKAMDCVAQNLALFLDRKRIELELKTLQNNYFDFVDFYNNGIHYNRFLDNVFSAVMKDQDNQNLLLNATRAIRCSLLKHQTSPSSFPTRSYPFIPAVYALANTLFQYATSLPSSSFSSKTNISVETTTSMKDDKIRREAMETLPQQIALKDCRNLLEASLLFPADWKEKREKARGEGRPLTSTSSPYSISIFDKLHIVTVASERRASLDILETSCNQRFMQESDKISTMETKKDKEEEEETGDAMSKPLDEPIKFQYEFSVLGLGQRWYGLGSKILLLKKKLIEIVQQAPHHIVLFCDAYDVIATQSAGFDLIEKFRSFHSLIVFGAEVSPAPDIAIVSRMYFNHGDAQRLPPLPYLNSGLFMGEAHALLTMVNEVIDDIETHMWMISSPHSDHMESKQEEKTFLLKFADIDDQRWFTRYYLRHNSLRDHPIRDEEEDVSSKSKLVSLDTTGLLFHSLHAVDKNMLKIINQEKTNKNDEKKGNRKEEGRGNIGSDGGGSSDDNGILVYSELTKSYPCFLHGNAGGREILQEVMASFLAK